MKIYKMIIAVIISISCIVYTGCGTEQQALTDDETLSTGSDASEEDQSVIKWGLIDIEIDDLEVYETSVNNILKEMGIEYEVRFESVVVSSVQDYESYAQAIVNAVACGDYDLVTTACSVSSYSIIRSLADNGLVESLNDWMETSETGNALYGSYPERYWELISYDDQIYGLTPITSTLNRYIVFNASIAEEYGVDISSVTLDDLGELFEKAVDSGMCQSADGFVISTYLPYKLLGAEYQTFTGNIFLLSEDEGVLEVEDLLSNDDIMSWMKTLNEWYVKGYITNNYDIETISNGDFFSVNRTSYSEEGAIAAVRSGYDIDDSIELAAVELEEFAQQFSGGSAMTSVTSNSQNKSAAMEVLGLIYSEESLSNAIVYGEEGVSYTIEDGHVYLDEDLNTSQQKVYFGNTLLLMPEYTESSDKAESLTRLIECSEAYLGVYKIDLSEYAAQISDINVMINEEYSSLLHGASDDWENDIAELIDILDSMQIGEIIEYMNVQLTQ